MAGALRFATMWFYCSVSWTPWSRLTLCFFIFLPLHLPVEGTLCAAHHCLPHSQLFLLINGRWVYATERSSQLKNSILRFCVIIFKRASMMSFESFFFSLCPVLYFLGGEEWRGWKWKMIKISLICSFSSCIQRVSGIWYLVNTEVMNKWRYNNTWHPYWKVVCANEVVWALNPY